MSLWTLSLWCPAKHGALQTIRCQMGTKLVPHYCCPESSWAWLAWHSRLWGWQIQCHSQLWIDTASGAHSAFGRRYVCADKHLQVLNALLPEMQAEWWRKNSRNGPSTTPFRTIIVFTRLNQPITFHRSTVVQYIPPPHTSVVLDQSLCPGSSLLSSHQPLAVTVNTPPHYYSMYPMENTGFNSGERDNKSKGKTDMSINTDDSVH